MCGRFTLRTSPQQVAQQFRLLGIPDLEPRYNIAPTQSVAVVRQPDEGDDRELARLHWGLVPSWADDPKIGARMINARSETAADKPSFRAAFKRRRCLIPADGFYEWQKQPDGKQPYHIGLADDGLFAFAGLWVRWSKAEPPLESCTILTTEANELLAPLHDRMPVILSPDDYDLWLDADSERAELEPLLDSYPAEEMRFYPVARSVNRASHDEPDCVAPLE